MNVALLHLLPEANEAFENLLQNKDKDKIKRNFPFSFFLALLGYIFILLIEKIVFDVHNHDHDDPNTEECYSNDQSIVENTVREQTSSKFINKLDITDLPILKEMISEFNKSNIYGPHNSSSIFIFLIL